MSLHDSAQHQQSTVLRRVSSLTIFWGRRSPQSNSNLLLHIEELTALQDLSIHLHPHLMARTKPLRGFMAASINPQLARYGLGLRSLHLPWRLEEGSLAWAFLGTPRRLTCQRRPHNLVKLQVSSQLLFRELSWLTMALHAATTDDELTEDEMHAKILEVFLPRSLQVLSLVEHWTAEERDLEDDKTDGTIQLDAVHEQGDWMEMRWRDEHGGGVDNSDRMKQLADEVITTPSNAAVLGLVKLLCRVWLGERRDERVLEVTPQSPWFYTRFIHPLLMASDGLEDLRARSGLGPNEDMFEYSFIDTAAPRDD